MRKAEQFKIVELGTTYELPKYRVIDGKGIEKIDDINTEDYLNPDWKESCSQQITFVRGDKTDGGKIIPRVDGITQEQLLGMMITDLEYKNSLFPSKESEEAIKNLKLALFWLEERQRDREKRNVVGTYQK
jgi:hypothetical protein